MASKGHSAVTKGKNYERKIAKVLSQAFKVNVNRTAGSGSWRGIDSGYSNINDNGYHNQAENALTGDLFLPTGVPNPFSFELKNHDKFKLSNIFNNNGEYPSYLKQCVTDSRRSNHAPCLILHEKQADDYVVVPFSKKLYEQLISKHHFASLTLSSYYDERLEFNNYFYMLVTNLTGLCDVSLPQLNEDYSDLDWDILNKDKEQKPKEINYDDLIRGIKP